MTAKPGSGTYPTANIPGIQRQPLQATARRARSSFLPTTHLLDRSRRLADRPREDVNAAGGLDRRLPDALIRALPAFVRLDLDPDEAAGDDRHDVGLARRPVLDEPAGRDVKRPRIFDQEQVPDSRRRILGDALPGGRRAADVLAPDEDAIERADRDEDLALNRLFRGYRFASRAA